MNNKSILLLISSFLLFSFLGIAQSEETRWNLNSSGGIVWDIRSGSGLPHADNIEMDGKKCALILYYEVSPEYNLSLQRHIIYPQMRTRLKHTDLRWAKYRAYLKKDYSQDILPKILADDKYLSLAGLDSITINGWITFHYKTSESGIRLEQSFIPSADEHAVYEHWTLHNTTDRSMAIKVAPKKFTESDFGIDSNLVSGYVIEKLNTEIKPGQSAAFNILFFATRNSNLAVDSNYEKALEQRKELIDHTRKNLILLTPDQSINRLFDFSKLRASESIYDSKMGLVHSPGGGRYYAGVWANDQAEYSGPFFPYLGFETANIAAENAYRRFFDQMKTIPEHDSNLWSSFEMSGDLTCCGGDRGDAAMIAYGGTHFLLAMGDDSLSNHFWPMIEWCLEYCHKKKNETGVIASDTDEMEGRIPTGNANLSTSSLYYGALLHTLDLGRELGINESKLKVYQERAIDIREAIENHFGANVEGLNTYRYFDGHAFLRHWICLPLVVGIHDRKDATIDALFNRLWTENGVHVEKNSDDPAISKIFWDRATLYALRGALIAGEADQSVEHLSGFSKTRLLGERVPYVVEAYPEGQMAHLSAESALYCRVITEGLFGIYPTGHKSFRLTPRLPSAWNEMELKHIRAFNTDFDIYVQRKNSEKLRVLVYLHDQDTKIEQSIYDGESLTITFDN